jgi:hypothetical protein
LRALALLELLVLAMLLAFSFVPLLPLYGWQGYGPAGEYTYFAGAYRLRYNDPTFGNDKPHIFAHIAGRPVDLIELSDLESEVNGTRLWGGGLRASMKVVNGTLYVRYEGALSLVKYVRPLEGGVEIGFASNATMDLTLTLWRWYYSSVEGYSRPAARNLTPSASIGFAFTDGPGTFTAQLLVVPLPSAASISGVEGHGLNKISLRFVSRQVTLVIRMPEGGQPLYAPLLDIRGSNYLYPLIALSCAACYLYISRRTRAR